MKRFVDRFLEYCLDVYNTENIPKKMACLPINNATKETGCLFNHEGHKKSA